METERDSLFRDSRYERMAEAMKLFIKCCDILKRIYLEKLGMRTRLMVTLRESIRLQPISLACGMTLLVR